MDKCPICKTEIEENQDYCKNCAWEFEYYFDELSEEERERYENKIKTYKKIYHDSLVQNNSKPFYLKGLSMGLAILTFMGILIYFILEKTNDSHAQKSTQKDVPLNIKISSNVVYITPSHGIPLKDGNSSVFNLTNTILPKIKNKKLIINKKNREFSFDICGDTTYLLTIGINDYGGYEPLRYAELDALRFKIKIENSCGMVKSVTLLGKEATRNNIITNLEKMSTTKDDVVLVYFTGHAITADNQAYLIPYIGRTLDNKEVVVNKAMNLKLLSDVLNSKQGKESLVVIDSQINDVWSRK